MTPQLVRSELHNAFSVTHGQNYQGCSVDIFYTPDVSMRSVFMIELKWINESPPNLPGCLMKRYETHVEHGISYHHAEFLLQNPVQLREYMVELSKKAEEQRFYQVLEQTLDK